MLKTVMIAKLMTPEKDPDLFRMLLWGKKRTSMGNGLEISLIVHHWSREIAAQRQAAPVILNLQVIRGRKERWVK